jgi:hypothetical protein
MAACLEQLAAAETVLAARACSDTAQANPCALSQDMATSLHEIETIEEVLLLLPPSRPLTLTLQALHELEQQPREVEQPSAEVPSESHRDRSPAQTTTTAALWQKRLDAASISGLGSDRRSAIARILAEKRWSPGDAKEGSREMLADLSDCPELQLLRADKVHLQQWLASLQE